MPTAFMLGLITGKGRSSVNTWACFASFSSQSSHSTCTLVVATWPPSSIVLGFLPYSIDIIEKSKCDLGYELEFPVGLVADKVSGNE